MNTIDVTCRSVVGSIRGSNLSQDVDLRVLFRFLSADSVPLRGCHNPSLCGLKYERIEGTDGWTLGFGQLLLVLVRSCRNRTEYHFLNLIVCSNPRKL